MAATPNLLGGILSFFDKYVLGYAIGSAAGPALAPYVQDLVNEGWKTNAVLPPDAKDLAAAVAEGHLENAPAAALALEQGYGPTAWADMVKMSETGPALGYAFEAWRRGFLTDTEFETALKRTALSADWYPALEKLKTRLVDLPLLANGIQRGLVDAPFQLPYNPNPEGGTIGSFPTTGIDALATAEGLGYTEDDLLLAVGESGNPPGPEALYRALFRGAINDADAQRGLVEGRARGEWAPVFEAVSREIPTPANFVEGYVRNWIKQSEMIDGAARHGMTADDVNLLFLIHGRPLTHNQVFIGLLRGGVYDGPTDQIDPHFLKSLQESDMRPEWYNLAWAARYHFPPFFQTVQLLTKGLIDAPTATNWLTWQAYDPDAIATVVAAASKQGGTKTKTLTASQIRQAFRAGQLDEATALQRIQADGYTAADATTFLNS